MEHSLGLWVAPLLMIPGMALLAISTVNRYTQLLVYAAGNPEDPRLQRQLPLLRYTLIALYTGIAADALAAMLGGLFASDEALARSVIVALICFGAGCLFIASVFLIIDTIRNPLRPIDPPL